MSTVTINGYITYKAPESEYEKERWGFVDFKPTGTTAWGLLVREHTIEVEVPENFDPRQMLVQDLERQKQEVRAAFAVRIKQLDDRINRLLAIENTVEA